MEEKTICEFLNNEYKEYALYCIENRAIPSIIDGLKPSQRKILHVSKNIWFKKNEKFLKVFQLAGKVASDAFYHHGNMSLENAIINMAQTYKNNMPLLDGEGQFGSLRSPDAGAPRYIGVKLSKNFELLYKDFELLEYKEEEGELVEPKYFLPIVPTVLINGSSGIAVGFSSLILNRNPIDVIDACINYLSGKKINTIKPYINCFNGDFILDDNNKKRWIAFGKYKFIDDENIMVSELPPSVTYEKYEKILEDLCDKNIILNYEDNSKEGVEYIIKINKQKKHLFNNDENIVKILHLKESYTENYTLLDENGKLKIFDCVEDIIKYFVDIRLKYYIKRIENQINNIKYNINILKNKLKFINHVIKNEIKINNTEKNIIIKQIEQCKIEKINGSYDYLLKMPIYNLTKNHIDELNKEIKNYEVELNELYKTDHRKIYINDLINLRNVLQKNNMFKRNK